MPSSNSPERPTKNISSLYTLRFLGSVCEPQSGTNSQQRQNGSGEKSSRQLRLLPLHELSFTTRSSNLQCTMTVSVCVIIVVEHTELIAGVHSVVIPVRTWR